MMESEIGPLSVRFDLSVERYLLAGEVTPQEMACLRTFFYDLRLGPIRRSVAQTGMNVWLVHVCNHIIEMQITRPGSAVVRRLYRDLSSSLPG